MAPMSHSMGIEEENGRRLKVLASFQDVALLTIHITVTADPSLIVELAACESQFPVLPFVTPLERSPASRVIFAESLPYVCPCPA